MRLTQSDRDAFVRSVMDDVPKIDYTEQANALIKKHLEKVMPEQIKAIYDNRDLRDKYLVRAHVTYSTPFSSRNCLGIGNEFIGAMRGYEMPAGICARLEDLNEKAREQKDHRGQLRAKVSAMINGCTTLKQAKERLPEFEKYLPADRDGTGVTNLPAVSNVVADLTKAGWPKKEKKAA